MGQLLDGNARVAAPMLRDLVIDHCMKDTWSAEARACVAAVKTAEDLSACRDKLGDAALPLTLAIAAELRKLDEAKRDAERRDGIKLNLPGRGDSLDPRARSLVLDITTTTITVGGKPFTDEELEALFRVAFTRDHDTQVILRAVKGIEHGRVIQIMERAKAAGLTHLAIGTLAGPGDPYTTP